MSKRPRIPHLFGKCMVVWCIGAGTACTVWALLILTLTGQDATNLLVPVFAFFGGELALMFGRNALQHNTKESGKEPIEDEYYKHS